MAENPHDNRRENEFIIGLCIPIYIYEGKNEVRGKIYSEFLKKG